MKFSIIILFTLVTMTLILVPPRTCQENEDKHLMFTSSENLGYERRTPRDIVQIPKSCPKDTRSYRKMSQNFLMRPTFQQYQLKARSETELQNNVVTTKILDVSTKFQ